MTHPKTRKRAASFSPTFIDVKQQKDASLEPKRNIKTFLILIGFFSDVFSLLPTFFLEPIYNYSHEYIALTKGEQKATPNK